MNEPKNATSDQVRPPHMLPTAPVQSSYKGVDGWLLFFCLGLTVFSPVITLASLASSYSECSQYFEQFPGLLDILVIDTLLSVGLMSFSIYAGVGLWNIRPGAVKTAKLYLLCFLGYHAIVAVMPFSADLPSAANSAIIDEVCNQLMRGVVYFAIWYAYLGKSQRVKATYES